MKYVQTIQEDTDQVISDLGDRLADVAGTTFLVSGAQGFIGSYVVDVLARYNDTNEAPPCRIICVDNSFTAAPDRLAHLADRDDVVNLQHDIAKPLILNEPVHWIVHCAGIASPIVYRRNPLETIDANVGGTRNMLDIAKSNHVHGAVVISSSEIYGDPQTDEIPTPEDYKGNVSCFGPRACYDESKRLAETLCWIYHHHFEVPVSVIRPFNIFGPGLRLDDGRVLPDFLSSVLDQKPLVLLSNGAPTRTFCYVSDFVCGLLHVLLSRHSGDALNVGNDQGEISMLELAKLLAEIGSNLHGTPLAVESQHSSDAEYLTDNPQHRCPNIDRMRSLFPWRPNVSLSDGLIRTLSAWHQAGH